MLISIPSCDYQARNKLDNTLDEHILRESYPYKNIASPGMRCGAVKKILDAQIHTGIKFDCELDSDKNIVILTALFDLPNNSIHE